MADNNLTIEVTSCPYSERGDLGNEYEIYEPERLGGWYGWPAPERLYRLSNLVPGTALTITAVKDGAVPATARSWGLGLILWDGTEAYTLYEYSYSTAIADPAPIEWTVPEGMTEAYLSVAWFNYSAPPFPNDPEGQRYYYLLTITGPGGGPRCRYRAI